MIRALISAALAAVYILCATSAGAAPYAAIVIDARNGDVLHSRSADASLHPASLTKMMTLYLAFQAVEEGRLSLDQQIRISRNASSEPPSKLGLRSGQRISLRYLIRAAAVKSANDAATALGETIAGSESAFADLMTQTAQRMGMSNTTFRNAHGLTASGHMSSARDMSILARHLFYDFPQYYNIFGRTETNAGIATVRNTNRLLLNNYRGADGIKTGYTRAAGYNLAASAQRGNERIIAVIFGGRSSAWRYNRMVELLDMGFDRAPTHAAVVRPRMGTTTNGSGRTSGAVMTSMLPMPRGNSDVTQLAAAVDFVGQALVPGAQASVPQSSGSTVLLSSNATQISSAGPIGSFAPLRSMRPQPRPTGGDWAVQLGAYRERNYAEAVLTNVLVTQIEPLTTARRQVEPTLVDGVSLYRAQFIGLSETQAQTACNVLRSQSQVCRLVSPNS